MIRSEPGDVATELTPYLFVYGTLLRPSHFVEWKLLRQGALRLGPARFQGRLFDLGKYPAVLASENPRHCVHGEAFRMLKPARMLYLLDQFEDCTPFDPEPHMFKRQVFTIQLSRGGNVPAWIYLYNWPLSRGREVLSGRYRKRR